MENHTHVLKMLGFALGIVHHQLLDGRLAVYGLVHRLDKLVEVLIKSEKDKLLWPVATAVCNDCLPLDISADDQQFNELVEVVLVIA
jgi:hypothetical protein